MISTLLMLIAGWGVLIIVAVVAVAALGDDAGLARTPPVEPEPDPLDERDDGWTA